VLLIGWYTYSNDKPFVGRGCGREFKFLNSQFNSSPRQWHVLLSSGHTVEMEM
jgi:hypothetical protein